MGVFLVKRNGSDVVTRAFLEKYACFILRRGAFTPLSVAANYQKWAEVLHAYHVSGHRFRSIAKVRFPYRNIPLLYTPPSTLSIIDFYWRFHSSSILLGVCMLFAAYSVLLAAWHRVPRDWYFRDFLPWLPCSGVVSVIFQPKRYGIFTFCPVIHYLLDQPGRSLLVLPAEYYGSTSNLPCFVEFPFGVGADPTRSLLTHAITSTRSMTVVWVVEWGKTSVFSVHPPRFIICLTIL